MTITTEEIELLAQTHDLVRFTLGMKAPEHDLTAAALRSLAAERDALQAENARLREALDFYADVSKYPAPFTGGMGALWEDCGKIARAALGETQ
jgi:hypothetical protein